MIEKFTEKEKKEILEKLTVQECKNIIDAFRSDIDQVKQNDPEDFFDIKKQRRAEIKYYKRAIKLLEEFDKKKSDFKNNIKFNISEEDMKLIFEIMIRICDFIIEIEKDKLSREKLAKFAELLHVDLMVCHINCCALDLKALLNSDNETLYHDIAGIFENINRQTFNLDNGFVPRCAR